MTPFYPTLYPTQAAVGWEAIYAKPAAKWAKLGAAERATLDAVPHRYVEDLSGLLPLLGCTATG